MTVAKEKTVVTQRVHGGIYADLLEKLRLYGHRLMRGPSPLTCGQRELIAAYVSGVNSCRYCHGSHSLVAQAFGIDESMLTASLNNIETAPIGLRLNNLQVANGYSKWAKKLRPIRFSGVLASVAWLTSR